jgi:hypothetical protein
VIAFRLAEHARTAHGTELLDAAGRCGVQNTPPGGAGVALAARVDGVTADSVHVALEQDRTLLQAFSLRADPHVFPTADRPTFTQRLLPDDEEALRGLLTGAVQALDRIGISASDVVDLAADAAPAVLDGKALTKDDLGREIGDVLTDRLPTSADRRVWRSPSWYASGQFLGESVVRFVLPVLALRGELCHGARSGRSVLLCRTDQWLRTPPAEQGDPRADLVRRYLRCYGPSTSELFARWAGITPSQAIRSWDRLRDALVPVEFGRGQRWIHRDDQTALTSSQRPSGVRLLPPHDPYLQTPDRDTLVADPLWRKRIWRSTGTPGAVLADGEITATWRARTKGHRLDVTIEPMAAVPDRVARGIIAAADEVARYRGRVLRVVDGLT